MNRKFILMAVAVLLAAGVLLLAYLAEPPAPGGDGDERGSSRPAVQGIDPDWDAGNFDTAADRNGQLRNPLQGAGQTRFTRINEKGQLEVYKGDPITPLPGGWWEVGKPEFIFHLDDHRVIRLTADQGKLYAPAEPRSGQLQGQVKLQYFDTRDDHRQADIADDSSDLQFRMLMQDVQFDRDLFRLETDGPFHMTSAQFDYVGQHLRLVYSDANRRIETLEVQKSQWLRINPGSSGKTARGRKVKPEGSGATATQPAGTQPAGTQSADSASDRSRGRPVQFYRATFPGSVHVQNKDVDVHCEVLELVFSLQDQDGHQTDLLEQSISRRGGNGVESQRQAPQMMAAMLRATGSPLQQAMMQMLLLSMAQTQEGAAAQSGDALAAAARRFESQTLSPAGEDDILITWQGALKVEPVQAQVAAQLALAGAEDVHVSMRGRPVRISSPRGETVRSASLTYLVSSGTLALLGDGLTPVQLESPELGGMLQANNFTLDQYQGVGMIQGPGLLRAYKATQPVMVDGDASLASAVGNSRLPEGFSVAWHDGLDLAFYSRDGAASSNDDAAAAPSQAGFTRESVLQGEPVRISAIRSAIFRGNVTVAHPSFDVRSDALSIALARPLEREQSRALNRPRQQAEHILASGDVRVGVRGSVPSQHAEILCQDLTIHLGADERGRLAPQRLVAQEDVKATTAEGTLKAQRLTAYLRSDELLAMDGDASSGRDDDGGSVAPQAVHLQPTETAHAPGQGPVSTDAFAAELVPAIIMPPDLNVPLAPAGAQAYEPPPLRQLVAEDSVEIELGEPAMHIKADRLVSDFGPVETQVELFGQPGKPVTVQRQGVLMTGPRVVFAHKSKTLHIPGAGMMAFYSQSPIRMNAQGLPQMETSQADDPDASPDKPATLVNITWRQAMHFDDRGGAAQFLGDVVVDGSQGDQSTRLSCEDLRLEFIRQTQPSFGLAGEDELTEQQRLLRSIRQVRSIIARDDVAFEAQATGDSQVAGRPETRVRITGPLMTFSGQREQVQVIGPGSMLIEDYRPSRKPAPGKVETPQTMIGRGATAFRWQGGLTLDAAYNDMIISEAVQMIHAPIDNARRFQMDCRHLVADLENTGGLGSISQAPTPQINAIYADGAVRLLTDDKQVTTDHLEYDGRREMVLLSADAGRYTTISQEKTPVPLTYRQIKWYLRDNRFEGIEPGRGVVPLLRDSRRDAGRR